MTIIIDASVALKWVSPEVGSDRAADLLNGQTLVAPSIWLLECANALWRRVRQGTLLSTEADELLQALRDAPVRPMDSLELTADALSVATAINHPVYDCLYVAAAQRSGGTIITADRRFHAALQGNPVLAPLIRLL
ncbi:type II toxin-antitoxin system VapC family toxin [Niveispirillum irakense]|uniref:type II toxin-antitoxin system VapC family toxin n=1 Tax=Niveispirillum irakense TaxID=34011 RepID=UPI00040085B8|nr:type II toxin-antitoxin system VapC family toxin [Niveispirillum irakense]